MEKIEWSEDFSVGVKILDDQHKQLIELVNGLFESTHQAEHSRPPLDTLAEMRAYAKMHFDTEEKLMLQHRYAGLDEHKRQHREFEQKTNYFIKSSRLPINDLPDTVLVYLRYWWLNHVLVEDMKYKELLSK